MLQLLLWLSNLLYKFHIIYEFCIRAGIVWLKGEWIMAVNRFVLNGISYHGHGAINEIPGSH